jgi:hypothetical protein
MDQSVVCYGQNYSEVEVDRLRLGALHVIAQSREGEPISFPVEGFDGGSVSMLSVQIG